MTCKHRKFIVNLFVGAEENRDVQLPGFLYVYIMPKSDDRIHLEFLCEPDDLDGIVPGLGNKMRHRIEYTPSLRIRILDETIQETSL